MAVWILHVVQLFHEWHIKHSPAAHVWYLQAIQKLESRFPRCNKLESDSTKNFSASNIPKITTFFLDSDTRRSNCHRPTTLTSRTNTEQRKWPHCTKCEKTPAAASFAEPETQVLHCRLSESIDFVEIGCQTHIKKNSFFKKYHTPATCWPRFGEFFFNVRKCVFFWSGHPCEARFESHGLTHSTVNLAFPTWRAVVWNPFLMKRSRPRNLDKISLRVWVPHGRCHFEGHGVDESLKPPSKSNNSCTSVSLEYCVDAGYLWLYAWTSEGSTDTVRWWRRSSWRHSFLVQGTNVEGCCVWGLTQSVDSVAGTLLSLKTTSNLGGIADSTWRAVVWILVLVGKVANEEQAGSSGWLEWLSVAGHFFFRFPIRVLLWPRWDCGHRHEVPNASTDIF